MNIYLDSKNHPHIKIVVLLSSPKQVDCFIDTGYTGGLSLPDKYRSLITSGRLSFQDFEIGDGTILTEEMFRVKIRYEKAEKHISLMFTKEMTLWSELNFSQVSNLPSISKSFKLA